MIKLIVSEVVHFITWLGYEVHFVLGGFHGGYFECEISVLGAFEHHFRIARGIVQNICPGTQGMRIWRMGRKHLNRGRRMQPVPIDELGLQFIKCFNLS